MLADNMYIIELDHYRSRSVNKANSCPLWLMGKVFCFGIVSPISLGSTGTFQGHQELLLYCMLEEWDNGVRRRQ